MFHVLCSGNMAQHDFGLQNSQYPCLMNWVIISPGEGSACWGMFLVGLSSNAFIDVSVAGVVQRGPEPTRDEEIDSIQRFVRVSFLWGEPLPDALPTRFEASLFGDTGLKQWPRKRHFRPRMICICMRTEVISVRCCLPNGHAVCAPGSESEQH